MKAIIPVAGRGTRLRPHTHSIPKALLFVAGKPILGHILDQVLELGIKDVVLIVGYLRDKIERYVTSEYPQVNFSFTYQKERKGPGHAIYLTREHIKDEDQLLIIYGDTVFIGDLSEGLKSEKDAVLAVKKVEDPRRFGVCVMEGDKIVDVVEKPDYVKPMDAMIGIYFVNKAKLLFDALQFMVDNERMTKGEFYLTDAFKVMIEKGNYLTTFQMDGWYDCGKPDTLLETNRYLLDLKKPETPQIEGCTVKGPVYIDEAATIKDSVIGPNVSVGRGVEIVNSKVEDSVISKHSYIENSDLKESIIGEDALVKRIQGKINIGCHAEISSKD